MGPIRSIRVSLCLAVAAMALLSAAKTASGQTAPIRYVFGTNSYTDSKGQFWSPVPTSYLTGSRGYHWSNCSKSATFTGTPDPGLYQQQIAQDYGDMLLTVPVSSGSYTVNLYFAEPCANTVAGSRFFGLIVNGTTVVASLDLTATAGVEKPVIETVQVTGSQIALDLKRLNNDPLIAAVEILPQSSSSSFQIAAKLHWDDGTPVAGTVVVAQIISSNPTSSKTLGSFPLDTTGATTASLIPDLTLPLSFSFTLINSAGTIVNTLGFTCDPSTLKVFPRTLSPQIVLAKASATLKSLSF
jgi:hypothetical protein